jgi:hypothetical protein
MFLLENYYYREVMCMQKYYFCICGFILEQLYVFPSTPQNSTNDLEVRLNPFGHDVGYIQLSSKDTVSNIYKACLEWYKENCKDSDIRVVYNKYILAENNEQTFAEFLKAHNLFFDKEPTFQLIVKLKRIDIQSENYYNTDLLTQNNYNEKCEFNYCCRE